MNKPGLLQIIHSVLAAAFGVQSDKNRERDFQYGSPAAVVVIGIIATVIFIISIRLIVSMVLS